MPSQYARLNAPFHKQRRKKKKKKPRVTKVGRGVPTIPSTGNGFPAKRIRKLRYVSDAGDVTLNAGAGGLASHTFRAVSVNDPDQSGTGHQPLGYDQWTAFYQQYVVLKATCTVYYSTEVTSNVCSQIIGLSLDENNSFAPTTLGHACELPGSVFSTIATGQQTTRKLSLTYDAKKFYDVKDPNDVNDLVAAYNGNPNKTAAFHLYAGSMDGITNALAIDCMVVIDYLVEFSEPNELAQS